MTIPMNFTLGVEVIEGLLALRVMGEGIVELFLDLERDILGAF